MEKTNEEIKNVEPSRVTYIDYIKNHKKEIGVAKGYKFIEVYRSKLDELDRLTNSFSEFKNVYDDFPKETELFRKDVFEAFKDDNFYRGFVYTMLWGGLGLTSWDHLEKAMGQDKSSVERKIINVKRLLEENKIETAFYSLQNENKLEGIGVSYFTKLIYFLYDKQEKVLPIIYDKWGKYIHVALIIDSEEDPFSMYKIGFDKENGFYVTEKMPKGVTPYNTYKDYITKVAKLSKDLKLANPGILEEYLFGKTLKLKVNKDVNTNPRAFVKQYVINYYESKNKKQKESIFVDDETKKKINNTEKTKLDLIELFSHEYGNVYQGTPRDRHLNVKKRLPIFENVSIELKKGLLLRFNELKQTQKVRVSLVFDTESFTNEELNSLLNYYRVQLLETELDSRNNREFRIYREFSNKNASEAIEWMNDTARNLLELLPVIYYEIIPR